MQLLTRKRTISSYFVFLPNTRYNIKPNQITIVALIMTASLSKRASALLDRNWCEEINKMLLTKISFSSPIRPAQKGVSMKRSGRAVYRHKEEAEEAI
jgi:hypothetical protein